MAGSGPERRDLQCRTMPPPSAPLGSLFRLDSLEALLSAVRDWQGRLNGIVPPATISPALRRERVGDALRNVERRLIEGARAPLRFAIFGPTGAGKSKLFNSLVGEPL